MIVGGRAALVAVLALLALVVLAAAASAAHPADQDAHKGGSGLSAFRGNWTVAAGDDLAYANQTIDLDGNLSIESGGRLALRNVTLVLHGLNYSRQQIKVNEGGELVVTDWDADPATVRDWSNIKANDTDFGFYFKVFQLSKLTLSCVRIEGCGQEYQSSGLLAGLYIATENATIKDVDISKGFAGIFIDGVDITIRNAQVHDNAWDGVYVDGPTANPVLDGCTIERNIQLGVRINNQANLIMRNCKVTSNGRGIFVDNAYLTATDCQIKDNGNIDINLPANAQAELVNCTVSTSPAYKPILLENSSLTSTNGNFDGKRIVMWGSVFRYQQFLTVVVTWSDSRSTPIPGVNVTVQDVEGRVFEYMTGADGKAAWLPMEVMEYDHMAPAWRNTTFNPFHVTVSWNLVDKDQYVEMRFASAVAQFKFDDTRDPVAVAPSDMTVDTGANVTLDGSRCSDNVAIADWNWSFEERGSTVYLSGESPTYAFKEARVYAIALKVTDTSGRSGAGSAANFHVTALDRTPPRANAGHDMTVSEGQAVHLDGGNSTDNVGIVSYTWSFTYQGAPKSLTGVSVDFTFGVPGVYTVVLTVEDAVGLSDSASMNVTVKDTTAPVTTASLDPTPPANRLYTKVVQVFFTVAGERPGDYTIYYRVNGGQWRPYTGSLAFGDGMELGDGTYRIDYYSQDGAGNREVTKSIDAFTVDATSPAIIDLNPPVSPYDTKEATYMITGKTETGATVTVNSQPATVKADGTFSYNATLEQGTNTYVIISTDSAGHETDKTIVIEREPVVKPTETTGTNWMLIGGAVAAAVIVLLLVVYVVMTRKD